MKKAMVPVLGLALFLGAPLAAQETATMTGKWEFSYSTQRGPTTFTVTFAQDGETLTGKAEMTGGRGGGVFNISKGTIKGADFSFAIVRTFNENSFEQTFTGKVTGDAAEGTMAGGGRGGRGGEPVNWTAKRLPPGVGSGLR